MTEEADDDQRTTMVDLIGDGVQLEPQPESQSKGPWDPFTYLRKTISPTQRIELLRLEVPILPPEDFMDTADVRRSKRWPALIGLGALLAALLFAALWSQRPPSPSAVAAPRSNTGSTQTVPPHQESLVRAAISNSAGTTVPSTKDAPEPAAASQHESSAVPSGESASSRTDRSARAPAITGAKIAPAEAHSQIAGSSRAVVLRQSMPPSRSEPSPPPTPPAASGGLFGTVPARPPSD